MRKRSIDPLASPNAREKMSDFFGNRKRSNRQIRAAEEMYKRMCSKPSSEVVPQKQVKEKKSHASLWKRLLFRK